MQRQRAMCASFDSLFYYREIVTIGIPIRWMCRLVRRHILRKTAVGKKSIGSSLHQESHPHQYRPVSMG